MKDFILRAWRAANADELCPCFLLSEVNTVFIADLFIDENALPFLAVLRKLDLDWSLTRTITFPRRFVDNKNAPNNAGYCACGATT